MEHSPDLGRSSTRHGAGHDRSLEPGTDPEHAREDARFPIGDHPHLFALVRDFGDDEEPVTKVVAYGLTLPGGTAATVGADGHGFGRWTSAHNAARRLHSDLVWLGKDDMRRPVP